MHFGVFTLVTHETITIFFADFVRLLLLSVVASPPSPPSIPPPPPPLGGLLTKFARLLMVDTAIVDHLPAAYEDALHALYGDGLPPREQDQDQEQEN